MPKFRKKPVVIDADQFPFDPKDVYTKDFPQGVFIDETSPTGYSIQTLEGQYHVTPGDWIITGVSGERYPCNPDIFLRTYDPVKEITNNDIENDGN